MAWTTVPYTTVDEVKEALDLQGTDKDEFITRMIGEAQDLLDARIGYTHQVMDADAVYLYGGNGNNQLWVDDFVSITKVEELVRTAGVITVINDITTRVLAGPANKSPQYILEFADDTEVFTIGRQNYRLTATFGNPTVDPRLTRATLRLVTHWYGMMSTYYADMISDQSGLRQHYKKSIPDDVEQIIGTFHETLFICGDN